MGSNVDRSTLTWRTSSYSGTNGNCVEASSGGGAVMVRDTTNRAGETLSFATEAWGKFTASLR